MSVTLGNLTITDEEFMVAGVAAEAEATDMSYKTNAYLDAARKLLGEKGTQDGGHTWQTNVTIGDHSSITALPTGYEAINLNVNNIGKSLFFAPTLFVMPVVISGREKLINSGKHKLMDQYQMRTVRTIQSFMTSLNRQILKGDVARMSSLVSLNGVDSTTGILEENAFGSQTNVIGGLSKATYAAYRGMQNQRADLLGSFNANGVNGINSVFENMKAYSQSDRSKRLGTCSLSFMNNMKRAYEASEFLVYNGGDASSEILSVGHEAVKFRGVVFSSEADMPNDGAVTGASGNNDEISAYITNLHDIRPEFHVDAYFARDKPIQLPGYFQTFATIISVMVQQTVRGYGGSAVIIGGDTF
jgi:hypothetical protein